MSHIPFAKFQGIGNDFVMIADPDDALTITPATAERLCDRRFGIGADGVIRVAPGRNGADFFMDHLNSDGSEAEMCGNGIRCLAVFARQEGLTDKNTLDVGTRSGIKNIVVSGDRVRVDMGSPIFDPTEIPVQWEGADALQAKLDMPDGHIEVACVSMGNPHAVIFVDDPSIAPVMTLGPVVEHHPAFPNKTNVEFVTIESSKRVRMRVWERGVGETMACGTGACAVAVVARQIGGAEELLEVVLPGGSLEIEWHGSTADSRPVFMTGPAERVFDGVVDWPFPATPGARGND